MTRLLIINPGSTSTKVGLYENNQALWVRSVAHGEEIQQYPDLQSQLPFREQIVRTIINEENIDLESLDAIVGRGGLLHPLESGVYEVNEDMINDLESCRYGWHSSNLGGILAFQIASPLGLKAYISDPIISDEMHPLARVSGWPEIERKSIFHALNQKAVARRYAHETGIPYQEMNLIVAHLGGGISVGVHRKGRVIDVNNALNGDGPFSVERTGGLPLFSVIDLCFSGQYSRDQLKQMFVGKGGSFAYLGTSDGREIERRIEAGDEKAKHILEAMAYQVAKEIGAAAAVLNGEVDAILLTGGLAHNPRIVKWILDRVSFIAAIKVFPGEDEFEALSVAVNRTMNSSNALLKYVRED